MYKHQSFRVAVKQEAGVMVKCTDCVVRLEHHLCGLGQLTNFLEPQFLYL